MTLLLNINTADWPNSGAASTGTTGFSSLTGTWTHGVDAAGRKYIRRSTGTAGVATFVSSGTIGYSAGDEVRVSAGIMLESLGALDYTDQIQTILDTSATGSAEGRAILTLRHGTNIVPGTQFRADCSTGAGSSGTVTVHPRKTGLVPDEVYELSAAYHKPTQGGHFRFWVDGFLLGQVAFPGGVDNLSQTPYRIARWSFAAPTNGRFEVRLYGDRDGRIRVWKNENLVPVIRRELEEDASAIVRPIDIVEIENGGCWNTVSGGSALTREIIGSGGLNPGRYRARASNGTAVIRTVGAVFEESAQDSMLHLDGILIGVGGSAQIDCLSISDPGPPEVSETVFSVRFIDGDIDIKGGTVNDWVTIGAYAEEKYYLVRVNRRGGTLRVSIENQTDNFEAAATLSEVFASSNTSVFPIINTKIDAVQVSLTSAGTNTNQRTHFEMAASLAKEFAGLVSSYTASGQTGAPSKEIRNRVWNVLRSIGNQLAIPGGVDRGRDTTQMWAAGTLGRTGNEISDFVLYNGGRLDVFRGQTLVCIEWAVNDLSPARTTEGATLTARALIYDSMVALIDECVAKNIELVVANIIGYPTGGSSNWQSYTMDAVAWLNENVLAYMESKHRPDLLYWSEVTMTVEELFDPGDDIHFATGSVHAEWMVEFLENIEPAGEPLPPDGGGGGGISVAGISMFSRMT